MEWALDYRKKLLAADICTFHADVTADYGESVYKFAMDCRMDDSGKLQCTLTHPDTIRGITFSVCDEGGSIDFDDQVLAFPILVDDQLTPVSAPWLFLHTLQSGYISGCGREGENLILYMDDSFYESPISLQIGINGDTEPVFAQIYWKERRVLSVHISDFTMQ